MKAPTAFAQRVYQQLRKVPAGKVTTYKALAQSLGTKSYQAVGTAMKNNPYAPEVPCHRVVKTNGMIGGFMGYMTGQTIEKKRQMLQTEGIEFEGVKIKDFEKKLFQFQ